MSPGQERYQQAIDRSSKRRNAWIGPTLGFLTLGAILAGTWCWAAGKFEPEAVPMANKAGARTATVAKTEKPAWYESFIPKRQAPLESQPSLLASKQEELAGDFDAGGMTMPAESVADVSVPVRAAAPVVAATPIPTGAAPLGSPDKSALFLADRVLDMRKQRAAHLRWLDACRKERLEERARADIANARDDSSRNAANIRASNLAADIGNHQREVGRLTPLRDATEQRLAKYCAEHNESAPEVAQPAETVDVAYTQRPVQRAVGVIRSPATRQRGYDAFSAPKD